VMLSFNFIGTSFSLHTALLVKVVPPREGFFHHRTSGRGKNAFLKKISFVFTVFAVGPIFGLASFRTCTTAILWAI